MQATFSSKASVLRGKEIVGFRKGCPDQKSLNYSGNGDDVWTDKVDKKLGRKKL